MPGFCPTLACNWDFDDCFPLLSPPQSFKAPAYEVRKQGKSYAFLDLFPSPTLNMFIFSPPLWHARYQNIYCCCRCGYGLYALLCPSTMMGFSSFFIWAIELVFGFGICSTGWKFSCKSWLCIYWGSTEANGWLIIRAWSSSSPFFNNSKLIDYINPVIVTTTNTFRVSMVYKCSLQ